MQAAKEARVRGGSGEGADAVDSWKRPPAGWLKVNTDGARNSSTVCRVPRRVNRVADGLAKIARFDSLECITFEAPPDAIAALLQLDALEA
ncbi:hypothetical protein V6N11_050294 [Hibiscus sabdariffa]|uniref:RNase H type-1 domain-containing protein n=1 Tax=Hibiscus sabdariffa TaxID=183260 RepID=A0ABR2T9T5_9ROSI